MKNKKTPRLGSEPMIKLHNRKSGFHEHKNTKRDKTRDKSRRVNNANDEYSNSNDNEYSYEDYAQELDEMDYGCT